MKMKKGFTLIELIITIVIMAGIFAVIPKIVFATGKSDAFAVRQDGLMQALSLTHIASRLAWDEQNTDHLDILQTPDGHPDCNVRPGSWLSANGRMCTQNFAATAPAALGPESGEEDYRSYDDIDDFNAAEINATHKVKQNGIYKTERKYRLINSVTYLTDTIMQENGTTLTIDLSQSAPDETNATNIKRFKTKVRYSGTRGREYNISGFSYYSTNIGQISLAYRNW